MTTEMGGTAARSRLGVWGVGGWLCLIVERFWPLCNRAIVRCSSNPTLRNGDNGALIQLGHHLTPLRHNSNYHMCWKTLWQNINAIEDYSERREEKETLSINYFSKQEFIINRPLFQFLMISLTNQVTQFPKIRYREV